MTPQNEFPFKAVYEYFARPLVTIGLPDGQIPPMMFSVSVMNDEVLHVTELPSVQVGRFFESGSSKDLFSKFLRHAVAAIGESPFCLVLVSEAWLKAYKKEDKKEIGTHGSLEFDPDASESVMITIYRQGCTRMGSLPINKDRSLTWQPLHDTVAIEGRLTTNQANENSPESASH